MITVKELHRRLEQLMKEDSAVGDLDLSACGVGGTLRVFRDKPSGKVTGLSLEDDSYMAPFEEQAQEALRLSTKSALKRSDMEYLVELCAETAEQGVELDLAYLHEFIDGCEDPFAFLENASVIEYKGILFDEWTIDRENGGVYGEMCQDCADMYKDVLAAELSDGGVGACSVKGCSVVGMDADTERHYYVDFDIEQIRVVKTREQTKANDQSFVFLHQKKDATWQAYIANAPAAKGDGKLCLERNYPVNLYYYRYDLNGSRVLEKDTCKDRHELFKTLEWIGACRNTVAALWGFDSDRILDSNIRSIFVDAFSKKAEIAAQELEEAEGCIENASSKPSLSEKIRSASNRTGSPSPQCAEKDHERNS